MDTPTRSGLDERLLSRLNCISCGQGALTKKGAGLSCLSCATEYPVKEGIPIIHKSGVVPERLLYPKILQEKSARQGTTFMQALLAAWRYYVALNERWAPRAPTTPAFWMDRVSRSVPGVRKSVLDVGGGSGPYKKHLAANEDLYVILEVDIDNPFLKTAPPGRSYVIGDGCTPLFMPESFDVIALFEVLEHVYDPFQLLSNCARWLKPSGVLVLSAPQYWHIHGWPNDYFRYTIHGLRHLSNRAGLEIADFWAMGGPFVLIWSMIELNFSKIVRFPVVQQIIGYPMVWSARALDAVFFPDNLERENPDTRGWMVIARKPV